MTTHEAKTHLSRLLAAVERGDEIQIARGRKVVARLVPVEPETRSPRPKVGEIQGSPFAFPDSAFAPMTKSELLEWGL